MYIYIYIYIYININMRSVFLDLGIIIKARKFQFSLFDERDSFPFSIVRMPDKSSNIPSSIVYC